MLSFLKKNNKRNDKIEFKKIKRIQEKKKTNLHDGRQYDIFKKNVNL